MFGGLHLSAPPASATALSLDDDQLVLPNGSEGNPTIKGVGSGEGTGDGIYFANNRTAFSTNGETILAVDNTAAVMRSGYAFGWDSTGVPTEAGMDVKLYRDAAGVLAQRVTDVATVAKPQSFRLYGRYIDASNNEYLQFVTTAGDYNIDPRENGSGTLRGLQIGGASSRLGFYGSTAIALQTGVAVSAAGIHAALVALNLITA